MPLAGVHVLVTRPRAQAGALAQGIAGLGGIPVLLPLLEISPVDNTTALHAQLRRPERVDLAIFISPNAVEYGVAAILACDHCVLKRDPLTELMSTPPVSGAGGEWRLPEKLMVATVGAGSAKALRERGVENVLVPSERFDSEGLLAMPELQAVAGWRVMIFRGDGGRELLGETLTLRGAVVEYVTCYHRTQARFEVRELLSVQAITVSSSEALGYLWQRLDEAARLLLRGTPVFVSHPRIADLAVRQGWGIVRRTGAGDDGVLSGLLDYFKQEEAS